MTRETDTSTSEAIITDGPVSRFTNRIGACPSGKFPVVTFEKTDVGTTTVAQCAQSECPDGCEVEVVKNEPAQDKRGTRSITVKFTRR